MSLKDKQTWKILMPLLATGAALLASCSSKMATHQRACIVENAPNFRDLGGYPSENGKHTAWRKIFRSQTLAQLSDSDVEKLKELGVKTVIDFRSDDEVASEPSRLPEGVKVVRLPIEVGRNDTLQAMQQLMTGALDSIQGVSFMQAANRTFVAEFAPQYKAFFRILLQPESYPVVFHCTAGKDRTGFAAAMLLSALGVDWDTVMNDYLLTNRYRKPPVSAPPIPEQAMPAFRQILSVQPSYLNAAKEEIIRRYGCIDSYLYQALSVGKEEKDKLMQYLLE
jgi:protein-tyrosine phosphatase